MRALSKGIMTFKKHMLDARGGGLTGCIGSPRSRVCRGDGRLCNVCFTGRTVMGRSHYFLMRKCASIVSVRRSKIRGIITSSKASLAPKRVHLVRHFAGGVAMLCSNSVTNVGTSVHNVSVLLRRKVGVGIYLLPSNSSPSSFTQGRGTARFRTFVGRRRASFVHFGAGLLLRSINGSPVGQTRLVGGVMRDVSIVPRTVIHSICVGRYKRLLQMRSGLLISRITGQERVRTRGRGGPVLGTGGSSNTPTRVRGKSFPPPFPPSRLRSSCRSCVPRRKGRNRRFCQCRQLVLRTVIHCKRGVVYGVRSRRKRRAPIDIVRCVIRSLGRSRLTFRGPLRQHVLARTTSRVRGPKFVTRHCFVTRSSPRVDSVTARLTDSQCRLDGFRSGARGVIASRRHLFRLIPALVVGFGGTVMTTRLGRVVCTLRSPTGRSSSRGYTTLVRHCGRVGRVRDLVTGELKSEIILE